MADLLFTYETVELLDTPLAGLGLNSIRDNLGACSWEEFDGRAMVRSADR